MKKDKLVLFSFIFLAISISSYYKSFNFQLNESLLKNKENEHFTYPRGAGQWNLVNLTINGTAVGPNAHNWSWVESQSWFGGGIGLEANPYRLENITIANSNRCIEIYNSEKYFILQNCNLYNSSQSIAGMGIFLHNVSNGYIQYNNISQLFYGIVLHNCSDISIYDNYLMENGIGILLSESSRIVINHNEILGNGIVIYSGTRIVIDYNEITGSEEYIGYGITLSFGSFVSSQIQIISNEISKLEIAIHLDIVLSCNISSNGIYDNVNGINVHRGYETTVQNNDIFLIYENAISIDAARPDCIVDSNYIYRINGSGILVSQPSIIEDTLNCLIQYNQIELCNRSGISLVNAYNISIKYNTLAENDDGITIEGSNYNNLIGNIIENNTNYGILIDRYYNDGWIPPFYTYSLSNNISLNTIRNNRKAGIYCQYSDGNIIIQNSIDNNSNGIYLSSFSILNQISNNDITNHNESGIFIIDQCDFNTVSDNRINYNYCGVNITQNSDGNELVGNNLLHNVICYTIAEDCDNTLLLDNVCSTETPNDFIWIILLVSGLSVAVIGTGIWYFKRKK